MNRIETNGHSIKKISGLLMFVAVALMFGLGGCQTNSPNWIEQPWEPLSSEQVRTLSNSQDGLDRFSQSESAATDKEIQQTAARITTNMDIGSTEPVGRGLLVSHQQQTEPSTQENASQVIRGQDPGYQGDRYPIQTIQQGQPGSYVPPANPQSGQFVPQQPGQGYPVQQTYQLPQTQMPVVGDPNTPPSYFDPNTPAGNSYIPPNYADIDVLLRETQTGKMTFGAAYNSNSGLVGQIIIDERNFDIRNPPRSIQDIIDGTAWRGNGQGFRLELVPGSEVQRYLVSFTEPYLFNSQVSFSASGYYFNRRYFDWDEERLGGRLSLGYRLTPDLSLSVGLRMEDVDLRNPRVATSPTLNAAIGGSSLYLAHASLINDTRDHPFMATEGSYLELAYYQGFGDFGYSRGEVDYRRYFLLRQRPDYSGRHTLSLSTKLGFSGSSTPIYENYFAGGFSTIRGFDFRGASPVEGDVRVGGRFQWLNTVEYMFPLTSDDMFKGVLFCDFGTVEREIKLDGDNFRVAPGFGFRVHMPIGGAGGAPLAFDFAFPVNDADTDDRQVFSFHMGVGR